MSAAAPAPAFRPPEDDYPVRAAGPLTRRDLAWVLCLTLLALIPRAWVAARLTAVCDDGYFYLAVANAYERGDYGAALHYLNINVYPVLIAGLHRLGLEPLTAAKLWGVLAGSLVVPPVFGWLRRMLDPRVALAACGLYALHPEFIELSAEPIRDATFWLLTATSLYFAWRSATERSLWLFAATGLAIAIAAHTRTEGWLLALPVAAWTTARWRDAAGHRLKVAFGLALCTAMTPAFVVAFNLTALAAHDRWEWGRLEHFRVAARWLGGEKTVTATPLVPIAAAPLPAAGAPVPATAPITPAIKLDAKEPRSERKPRSKVYTYVRSFGHALEPVTLLLMLIGAVCRPRLLVRPEHLVLSACGAAVLIAVAFRLATLGEINGRYFLLCYFHWAGAAGIGLLWMLNALERRWPAWATRPQPAIAVASLLVVAGAAQAGDAILGRHPSRETEGRLGEALAAKFGRDRSFLVVPQACRVGYFAAGHLPNVMLDITPIDTVLFRSQPEVIILERQDTPRAEYDIMLYCLELRGMQKFDLSGLPGEDRFTVLTAPGVAPERPLGLARRDGR